MPASQYADLTGPVAIVCNDAGAANAIFYGLRDLRGDFRVWATGPAAGIAQACNLPTNVSSLEEAISGASVLLSGTGWSSDVEHEARRLARKHEIPSIAVLDHWVNFPERFIRNDVTIHPDRWWVSDAFARTEAEKHFPADRIDLVPNHYVQAQLSSIRPIAQVAEPVLLYVLEPARTDWSAGRPGEFQALDYLAASWDTLGLGSGAILRLRPHPSDPPGKYEAWSNLDHGFQVEFDTSPDMAAAIDGARWVAGCESFGLTLALDAGRRVFCTLPPNAPPCRLPHDTLVHLRAMERA